MLLEKVLKTTVRNVFSLRKSSFGEQKFCKMITSRKPKHLHGRKQYNTSLHKARVIAV
jgi:hypothetical protein